MCLSRYEIVCWQPAAAQSPLTCACATVYQSLAAGVSVDLQGDTHGEQNRSRQHCAASTHQRCAHSVPKGTNGTACIAHSSPLLGIAVDCHALSVTLSWITIHLPSSLCTVQCPLSSAKCLCKDCVAQFCDRWQVHQPDIGQQQYNSSSHSVAIKKQHPMCLMPHALA